ncbi:MAG TPA: S-adenosylmethionine:tRNA ribosyltransferase-isomerase [Ilumatobacteraceae bacterium]|nr:S-adenosylmethionine:tRNA ribosyltransferase-isomerase [Ilumatobacteraceae bacterium]
MIAATIEPVEHVQSRHPEPVPAVLASRLPLDFELDAAHVASAPAEARGLARDGVRLMISRGDDEPVHATFRDLADHLTPGDLLVVNTSATVPAAVDAELPDGTRIVVHVSTQLPGGLWMVEARRPLPGGATSPLRLPGSPTVARLADGTAVAMLRPAAGSQRLWLATLDGDVDLLGVLVALGRPIRYSYVDHDWPIASYQTVFADEPGSAEMPSAARPFTADLTTRLIRHGIGIVTITLHTGVSSLEGHELPYSERFVVSSATAAAVNATRATGGHVIAVGTTVVRALESAADATGTVHPAAGWTDIVITPATGVRAVDGLVTGWHEPAATHLAMLEAVAGRTALTRAYRAAWDAGYLWHEFGDSHLLLPYAGGR